MGWKFYRQIRWLIPSAMRAAHVSLHDGTESSRKYEPFSNGFIARVTSYMAGLFLCSRNQVHGQEHNFVLGLLERDFIDFSQPFASKIAASESFENFHAQFHELLSSLVHSIDFAELTFFFYS